MKHILVFLSAIFLFPASSWAFKSVCGRFQVVKGDVQFKETSEKPKYTKAMINRRVCAGGAVKTGADARAMVVMPGGEEFHISPETEFVIAEAASDEGGEKKKVLVDLLYGKLRANVQKDSYKNTDESQFRIKTKTAVAGVRGTQFVTSFAPETRQSEVVTINGVVEVGQPAGNNGFDFKNSVQVTAGQKTIAALNRPPMPPVAVPRNEMMNINRNTNSSSSGASTAPTNEPAADTAASESPSEQEGEGSPAAETAPAESGDAKQAESGSNGGAAPAGGDASADRGSAAPASREVANAPAPTLLPPPPPPTMDELTGLNPQLPAVPTQEPFMPVCEFCKDRLQNAMTNLLIKVEPAQPASP